ncbi:MAG: hypothetical protein GY812_10635 [Actinomycetia bacterium]|nr:hypothetical protein [Actinomycetes bacterium]
MPPADTYPSLWLRATCRVARPFLAVVIVAIVSLWGAAPAGAEEIPIGPLYPISATEPAQEVVSAGADIPVTFGRRGPLPTADGWLVSGPAVPLLGMATVAMLAGGAMMLARRCRDVSLGLSPVDRT